MFQIKHGTLHNVTGRPVKTEAVTFLPADASLAGDRGEIRFSHPLSDYLQSSNPEAKAIITPHEDAPWTLGRILFLFGAHLLDDFNEFRSSVCMYSQSFIAVMHEMEDLAIPFECGERACQSGLKFSSEDSLSAELKDLIANSFWSLLLSNPTEVEDYECSMLHQRMGCGRIRFGIDGGVPFLVDTKK